MALQRMNDNPLITPADVPPSRPDFQVVCVFNCGATRLGKEIILLLRVAERPTVGANELVAPILDPEDTSNGIQLLRVNTLDPAFEAIDPRVFRYQGATYLTSLSHLRVARSPDGLNFTVDPHPAMFPCTREEEYGIEDPRITLIDNRWWINYSVISRYGVATALAVTDDFKVFERKGIIFAPDNRDVTLFPEKIDGRYACHHRPMAAMFGRQDIWYAESDNLITWGHHRWVCGGRRSGWDAYKVGGGAPPIRTEQGWLSVYHGADPTQRYCLGTLLTDLHAPYHVIGRSEQPILAPETDYETRGFFGNVVFSCGAVADEQGRVLIYYGASDEHTCAAETTLDELLASATSVSD